MTLDGARRSRTRCPICMDSIEWPQDSHIWRYDEKKLKYETVDLAAVADESKREDLRRHGYRRCANPSDDTPEHYLPATYDSYQPPLVVGLVGAPKAGKTHLLTAMIREAHQGLLAAYGLTVAPLDFLRHDQFRRSHIEPFERGEELPGTSHGVIEYADTLLLRDRAGARHPVTFFDIAGEDLQRLNDGGKSGRFLIGAGALLFVHALEDDDDVVPRSSEYQAFSLALERAQAVPNFARLPAAIVVTKADRLRYVPPADRWLRRPNAENGINADLIWAESRDAFAYLWHRNATVPLTPFSDFDRCTLHFVSASGGELSQDKRFPHGIRPMRVLQPLVALLAMAGVITGPEAEKVGNW